jgi:hypothetical protein
MLGLSAEELSLSPLICVSVGTANVITLSDLIGDDDSDADCEVSNLVR